MLQLIVATLLTAIGAVGVAVPPSTPSNAATVDPALIGVSIEFFTWPAYTNINATSNCLANIASFRGTPPPIRIGGTTQDRATYNPTLSQAVNYTVASPADAPPSLTYGPSFFTLAADYDGDVTLGLNRQLANESNTLAAAERAKSTMGDTLFAIELGNEPDLYASSSPIANGTGTWTVSQDAASESRWFSDMSSALGNVFQAGVYISWPISNLIPLIQDAMQFIKTFSRHSYPQSACNGASTNLSELMSHSGIVSYTRQFKSEAQLTHQNDKSYFLGETNSATCGGGGISPTFGAALWIVDYVLQGPFNEIDRYYFHQGTIGNCAYCWWDTNNTLAPYYGAAFVSEFLGSEPASLAMLDDGTEPLGIYALYADETNTPTRLLVYNSAYFDVTGTRAVASVSLTGLPTTLSNVTGKRLTAPTATTVVGDVGSGPTIGGASFDPDCISSGQTEMEAFVVQNGVLNVTVQASEALMISLQ